MSGYEREYYDQAEFWEQDLLDIAAERERITRIIDRIPSNVRTILDVGCGNGAFLNSLPDGYEAIGLDSSKEALKYVKKQTVYGNLANLPLEPSSFDLVTCLEVLEHLPSSIFEKALDELQRVSKKYIMISVPNDEDLDYHLVICPLCRCCFNPNRHLRSFNKEKLNTLLERFTLSRLEEIGPLESEVKYDKFLFAAYRLWRSRELAGENWTGA